MVQQPGVHDFLDWNIPEEYWVHFTRIQNQYEEDSKLQIINCHVTRCASCGQFMSTYNAYFNVSMFGKVHVKEKCVTKIIDKIRNKYSFWDWSL